MSTIHTALTGKSDSLIDAVRESKDKRNDWFVSEIALMEAENKSKEDHIVAPPIWCAVDHNNIHHPDYMRMVVHQMD